MANREEIAIVGYAARVPGAKNVEGFWNLLRDNRQTVSWITEDRFPTQPLYHPDSDQVGRSYTFAAGTIDDVWGFDAAAFGMSPREAEQVDPQQRHLLEVTHDALAHAGIKPSTLAGTDTGVYVGASSVDHIARLIADPSACDSYLMTGNTLSIMANRISYNLNIHGPSLTVDTACSSSLVALNLAAEAIRAGKIDTAIVGGVNLLLSPFSYIGFSRASMLSPTGRCRPFDADADGYVRAEGAITLVLRSLRAARKARNHVHAVIVGSGVGQDGRTTGLSLPSAESQRQLMENVYADFAVDPSDLSFVEAHGTGTKVGDPLEADAIGKALGQKRSQPLPIGSVKSNIGHLEPASGLAGTLKSILALSRGLVPATLHQKSPNPHIPFDELNLRVVDRNWRPPEHRGPSLAGVSSFGFGGTNAHVILGSGDTSLSVAHAKGDGYTPPLFLSAYTTTALQDLATAYVREWPTEKRSVGEFISAAAHLRDALPHRTVIHGSSEDEVRQHLETFAGGANSPSAVSGQSIGNDLKTAFLFSGNGSQWPGMGRNAWNCSEHFRDALTDVEKHFAKVQKWSVVKMLFADELAARLRLATYSQPLLLALQVATVRVLEGIGLTPFATLGHSVGEIGAAWAAGALSLDQAIEVVAARSRHQETARRSGTMAALLLSESEARRFLSKTNISGVDIAAINSARSVTVSGSTDDIDQLVGLASKHRISARKLDLDYPFHSALIDSVRAPLLRELEGLKPLQGHRLLYSSVTGRSIESDALGPEHWWRNVREPVRFESGFSQLLESGARVFVEIGPKPILASYVRDMLRDAGVRGSVVSTLSDADDRAIDCFEHTVSKVVVAGGHVEAQRFFGPAPVLAQPLPLYPWQHSQFKVRHTNEASNIFGSRIHSLLGARPKNDSTEWFSTLDTTRVPWIADHRVGHVATFPATGFLEVFLAAAKEIFGEGPLEVRDLDILHPLTFEGSAAFDTWLRFSPDTNSAEYLSRHRGLADWTLNARAIIGRSPISNCIANLPTAPRGTIVVPRAQAYVTTERLGYQYGPAFQRIREVAFLTSTCTVSSFDSPAEKLPGDAITDLFGLDAALHALFSAEDGGISYLPVARMLPIRFGNVRVFKERAIADKGATWTVRRTATSTLVDIDLFDESGAVVLSAQGVRLVEAPAEAAGDSLSLSYRVTTWLLDRPGAPTFARFPPLEEIARSVNTDESRSSDTRLLLEAGCLRSAWTSLSRTGELASVELPSEGGSSTKPLDFLKSALWWHLEQHGLARIDGAERVASTTCHIPEVDSIVTSLLTRDPTMAAEAACLSRLDGLLERLSSGDTSTPSELGSSHWRQLDTASRQIERLRAAALESLDRSLLERDPRRLVTLLLVGADHANVARDLCERFSNLEILITDWVEDRLEQARALLGDDAAQIRCVAWSLLESVSSGSVDLCVAIDALAEATASGSSLDPLKRLLRPNAQILIAELAPSPFWDIVRGLRPTWWGRSADVDFPVSALLSVDEWVDELQAAGFTAVRAAHIDGQAELGVLLQGVSSATDSDTDYRSAGSTPLFSWESSRQGGDLDRRLAARAAEELDAMGMHSFAQSLEGATNDNSGNAALLAFSDVVWSIEAFSTKRAEAENLTYELARLAERVRALSLTPARLWVVLDLGNEILDPLTHPVWCAISSAVRVLQNEYGEIGIRCLGFSGAEALASICRELLAPGEEREVFFSGDKRIVFRVDRRPAELPATLIGPDTSLRLAGRRRTTRDSLAWVVDDRPHPLSDEVEIEVTAAGVNFRDVMWNLRLLPEEALEDGYAGAVFGMECSGKVTRVGAAVDGFAVGDRVMAFVQGAFSSHVCAPAYAITHLPRGVSDAAGATIPVAFLTAYYSLVHLAHLKRGETVLVHGGAGAVGLAALQIAHHLGAKVIATAGTDEKRALLRALGAHFVCNSRTLTFADEISSFMDGKGVDVVLNSLAGEAMIRSLDCLKPFGRFVELGKRDFYSNTHVGLRPFRKNLSYFGVDVDQLMNEGKELAQTLFQELRQLFAEKALTPLPYRIFKGEEISDAFRFMQHGGQIGKIVVTPANRPTTGPHASGTFPVSAQGRHLIVGGTSGFGLASAEWLADRGATSLILASRSGALSEASEAKVRLLRQRGIEVEIASMDVTDEGAVARLLRQAGSRSPIKGVVHAAMVLKDRLVDSMNEEAIDQVVQPKVQGAINLERLTRDLDLDYLLFFSSATTLFGNPGQYNYVGANAFLEGLARRLRSQGRPALAVSWGGIEDAGYLARNIEADANLKKRFSTNLISARQALNGLDWIFDTENKQLGAAYAIARIDWAMAKRELAATRSPTFARMGASKGNRSNEDSTALVEQLRTMSADEAIATLETLIVEEIARVLRLPPKEVDRHRPLADIGMDSLMMLELRTTVERDLHVELPMMSLASGITPADVARRIAPLLVNEQAAETMTGVLAALSSSHIGDEAAGADAGERERAASAVLERSKKLEGPL